MYSGAPIARCVGRDIRCVEPSSNPEQNLSNNCRTSTQCCTVIQRIRDTKKWRRRKTLFVLKAAMWVWLQHEWIYTRQTIVTFKQPTAYTSYSVWFTQLTVKQRLCAYLRNNRVNCSIGYIYCLCPWTAASNFKNDPLLNRILVVIHVHSGKLSSLFDKEVKLRRAEDRTIERVTILLLPAEVLTGRHVERPPGVISCRSVPPFQVLFSFRVGVALWHEAQMSVKSFSSLLSFSAEQTLRVSSNISPVALVPSCLCGHLNVNLAPG